LKLEVELPIASAGVVLSWLQLFGPILRSQLLLLLANHLVIGFLFTSSLLALHNNFLSLFFLKLELELELFYTDCFLLILEIP
jgi:hypothetical protein